MKNIWNVSKTNFSWIIRVMLSVRGYYRKIESYWTLDGVLIPASYIVEAYEAQTNVNNLGRKSKN